MRTFPAKADLSQREKDIVRAIASGHSMVSAAATLNISYETGKTYLKRAREYYEALGRPAGTVLLLARRAVEDGLIEEWEVGSVDR